MKRPVGVILTAVAQVLGSLLTLLLSVAMLFLPSIVRNAPTSPSSPPMGAQFFYGTAAMYGCFAVLGFLTAIGLFRLRNWARYSTLVFAGLLVAMGLIVALVFAVVPIPGTPSASGSVQSGALTPTVRAIMAAFPLAFATLGAIWLYYFNRSTTKSYFVRADDGSDVSAKGVLIGERRVPLSISVIAVLNLIGAAFGLPMAFWIPATVFFGFLVTGVTAKVLTILIALAGVYVGVGLLRLSNRSRVFAIAMICFHFVNGLALILQPNRFARYMALYQAWGVPSQRETTLTTMPSFTRVIFLFSCLIQLAVLYFLVSRASAFRTEALPADSLADSGPQ